MNFAAFERISNASDIERHCPDGAAGCVAAVRRFMDRPVNRALAISGSGKTGTSWQFAARLPTVPTAPFGAAAILD